MPMRPRAGSAIVQRHRKSCASSSELGCLKECTSQPCGLTPGQDVLDDAILARRIDPLQDRENGPVPLGIEPLLQFGQALHAGLEQLLGFLLVDVEAAGVAGIAVGQLEAVASCRRESAR